MADLGGIDLVAGTIDQCIWFALLAGKPANLAATRATFGGAQGQRFLNLGFVPSLPAADPLAGAGTLAPVPATWQISSSTGLLQSVSVAADTTSGLTQTGVVRLVLPQGADIGAPPNDVQSDVMAGVGAKPPRVDDPDIDGILVGVGPRERAERADAELGGSERGRNRSANDSEPDRDRRQQRARGRFSRLRRHKLIPQRSSSTSTCRASAINSGKRSTIWPSCKGRSRLTCWIPNR